MKVFTLVFLLNLITCFIARLLHGGRLIVDDDKGSWFNTKIYFIAGILNQPIRAFHYFSYRGFCRVYLNYSVFGFNPKRAGKQLDKLMKDGDVVCGVSIGAKPIAYSTTNGFKRVLINPCTHPEILQPKYFWLIRIFAPLFKLLTFLLGWISILPLISAEGGRYSLALLADQLFWIGYGYPGDTNDDNNTPDLGDLSKTGIVMSAYDEFLDNLAISGIYHEADWVEIETCHARIGDQAVANVYQDAIDFLLLL